MDAERDMRKQIKEEEAERQRKNHDFMQQLREQGWREVRCCILSPVFPLIHSS